jgi:hypothetical protein
LKGWTAQAPESDNQQMGSAQSALPIQTDFTQRQLTLISIQKIRFLYDCHRRDIIVQKPLLTPQKTGASWPLHRPNSKQTRPQQTADSPLYDTFYQSMWDRHPPTANANLQL